MHGKPNRLSRRLPWDAQENRLTRAVAERTASGRETIDLTESNPTRVGLAYPEEELAEALRRAAGPDYRPHPLGLAEAREALAAALARPGDPVAPADLVLTSSTSEAYSLLFKLFGDPGDEVLAGVPSYPLLDNLAAADGLALRHFRFEPAGRRFSLDPAALAAAISPRSRLLVLVHPANPTGSFLTVAELEAAAAACAASGLPLVSDEVFADFPLPTAGATRPAASAGTTSGPPPGSHQVLADPSPPAAGAPRAAAAGGTAEPPLVADAQGPNSQRFPAGQVPATARAGPAAARGDILSFSLGGLSKGAGLPGWKLAWIRAGGPPGERRRVLAALELLADTYLSVATPVQRALPAVLGLAPRIRQALLGRLRTNLETLAAALAALPAVALLRPEGGWSAVVRVPRLLPDEDLAVALLERTGVLVHPGYFFDFATEGFLVLSLLPEPTLFSAGARRLAGFLRELIGPDQLAPNSAMLDS